jgi:hypothetical protein
MKAGTVIKWHNFPFPRYGGGIKARWFVCLGDSGKFADSLFVYLCTATTQLQEFGPGGKRERHTICRFSAKNTPFEEDCVVDIDEGPYALVQAQIENNKDVETKGQIGEQNMRMIYNFVVRSSHFSRKEKLDIHRSFNDAGITGLKIPK